MKMKEGIAHIVYYSCIVCSAYAGCTVCSNFVLQNAKALRSSRDSRMENALGNATKASSLHFSTGNDSMLAVFFDDSDKISVVTSRFYSCEYGKLSHLHHEIPKNS
jgi:hypothetical protein